MIEKETIEEILSATKIEEVLGDYLVMKKRGVNYEACCPFHNEKTPSFKISPVKGIFKCFGCGKSGNVVKFIMEHEKFTYPEALRMLAQRLNIIIPENNTYEHSDNYVSKTVLGAMELASNIFKEELMKDSASDVFKFYISVIFLVFLWNCIEPRLFCFFVVLACCTGRLVSPRAGQA